jgi:hypothetical protein
MIREDFSPFPSPHLQQYTNGNKCKAIFNKINGVLYESNQDRVVTRLALITQGLGELERYKNYVKS